MKALTLSIFCLALAACNIGYNPRYYYNNVEIANLTGDTIRDLKVQIGIEGRLLECAELTVNRICQDRFGKRIYPQDVVDISWRDAQGTAQSRQIAPAVPLTLTPGLPIRLIMEIDENGEIKAQFRQSDLRFGYGYLSLG